MDKEFIPYEQALALKELGFDETCFGYFYTEDKFFDTVIKNSELDEDCSISAPLYQQAFQFLLDQLESISITYFNDGSGNLKEIGFNKRIVDFDTRLECLVELLKLLKNKKKYESN